MADAVKRLIRWAHDGVVMAVSLVFLAIGLVVWGFASLLALADQYATKAVRRQVKGS